MVGRGVEALSSALGTVKMSLLLNFCPSSFGMSPAFFVPPSGSEREHRGASVHDVAAVSIRSFAVFAGSLSFAGCIPMAFRRGVVGHRCWRVSAGGIRVRCFWGPPTPFISLARGLQANGGAVFFGSAIHRDGSFAINACWLRLGWVTPAVCGRGGVEHRSRLDPAPTPFMFLSSLPGLIAMQIRDLRWFGGMGAPNTISWCRKIEASERLVH